MSPRSIRRALERKAQKLAAKQNRLEAASASEDKAGTLRAADSLELDSPTSAGVSSALSSGPQGSHGVGLDWTSNRASAPHRSALPGEKIQRRFTGPRTCEGKLKVSLNALKTGLTGRTVLLAGDDAAAYEQLIENYRAEYQPAGLRETELVQSLADTSWRLQRIPGLEMAIYAQGRCEFAGSFDEHDSSLRPSMIELQTHLKYEKQLRNLQLQESRLARRYEKEMAELRSLQKQRASLTEEANNSAGKSALEPAVTSAPATHAAAPRQTPAADFEFEFSTVSVSSLPATNHAVAALGEAA